MLTIQGERKHEKKEEREGYCYSECSYGSFYRAIPLPEGAEASKATADFHNGVLEVTVPAPSRPEPKARRVEVQGREVAPEAERRGRHATQRAMPLGRDRLDISRSGELGRDCHHF